MTGEPKAHETSISIVKAPVIAVDAGTGLSLKAGVSCVEECHLQAGRVRIVNHEGCGVHETELAEFHGAANETDEFAVKAPVEPGQYAWIASFPAQEIGGVPHEESSVPFAFVVKPHSTSIAVWDVPSPVAYGDKFNMKVGVKCSAQCNLVGGEISVYGEKGKKVATATLGDTVWPGTSGLYWAEVHLEGPGVEGYYSWRVEFRKPDLELPHGDASYRFGFATARPPEHVVTVEVTDKETKAPIRNGHILLRPDTGYAYRGYADERGMARVRVPKGEYRLYALGHEHEAFQTRVKVAGDVAIRAELTFALPSEGEDGTFTLRRNGNIGVAETPPQHDATSVDDNHGE